MAKIGLIGFGKLGTHIFKELKSDNSVDVDWVFDVSDIQLKDLPVSIRLNEFGTFADREVDLVVEVANHEAVEKYAPLVLTKTNLMVLSTTALANAKFENKIIKTCKAYHTHLYIPHGAILGLDGIQDGVSALNEITISTVKPLNSLDFSFTDECDRNDITDDPVTLYEGPTRGLCRLFPRNVNAHANLALAGLGFDKTKSVLVADPKGVKVEHQITARGAGLELQIRRVDDIEGVTGSYTLNSVLGTIRRVLKKRSIFRII